MLLVIIAFLVILCLLIILLNRRYKCGCGKALLDAINKFLSLNTVFNYLFFNWIKIGIATAPKAIDFVTGAE